MFIHILIGFSTVKLEFETKCILNTHCGKHNKLSKTIGVTIGLNGRND